MYFLEKPLQYTLFVIFGADCIDLRCRFVDLGSSEPEAKAGVAEPEKKAGAFLDRMILIDANADKQDFRELIGYSCRLISVNIHVAHLRIGVCYVCKLQKKGAHAISSRSHISCCLHWS
jgi:hypothetical protein